MTLEITEEGLSIETAQEIATAIGQAQLDTIDPGLSQDDDDPLRQMNVIVADEISSVEAALAVAFHAFDIDSAEDELLDNIGAFKGRPREEAQGPRVAITLSLLAGAMVSVGDTVASNIDNSKTWKSVEDFTATSSGNFVITFEATSSSYSAIPHELTVIPTIPGWVSATNALASSAARVRETDTAYRTRLKQGNNTDGSGSLDAIVDQVSLVSGVELADGRENVTWSADSNGLPGKSFQILVDDGAAQGASDDEIAQAIWDNKPPGIFAFGNSSGAAYDKKGNPQIVNFDRMLRLRCMITTTITVLPGWLPSQIDDVKTAVVAYSDTLKAGQDVISARVKGAMLSVQNTEDVTVFALGIYPDFGADATLPVSRSQRATISSDDIDITIVQLTETIP